MSWTGVNAPVGWLSMRGRSSGGQGHQGARRGDAAHAVEVRWTSSNHGRPFRAYCSCGWISDMHPSRAGAQHIADEHAQHARD